MKRLFFYSGNWNFDSTSEWLVHSWIQFIQSIIHQSVSRQNGVTHVVCVCCDLNTLHAVSSSNSVYNIPCIYREILRSTEALREHTSQAFRGKSFDIFCAKKITMLYFYNIKTHLFNTVKAIYLSFGQVITKTAILLHKSLLCRNRG